MPEHIPMLPKIDDQQGKILPAKSGVWIKETDRYFLQGLAGSLKIDDDLEDISNIDSIPDVWARPLLFKMALFDIGTTREFVAGLHDYVVGEWRSLLAMLALRNIKNLNIKAESVNFAKDESKMAQVFRALAPRESLDANENAWTTDIYIIRYNDIPIAMTSPVTLVASAADYSAKFGGTLGVPWSSDGIKLSDPIKELSNDERVALKAWLQDVFNNLKTISIGLSDNEQEIANNLLRCIMNYINDIDRYISNNAAVTTTIVASNLNLHIGTAKLLNKTVQGKAPTINDSAVRLIANPMRSNQKLIIVSPEMVDELSKQESIPPSQLVIWQGFNANDVTADALSNGYNKFGNITLASGVEFRRPEDFFYDKLAVIEPGNVFTGSLKIPGMAVLAENDLTPILPIKRELLEYFSPEEIVSRISFSGDDENIFLHFNFPLSGVGGHNIEYRFSKCYSMRDSIFIQQDVPVIEIWPNIKRDGWNKYYLYYENYQAQLTQNADVLVDEIYYVEPYTYGKELNSEFPAQGLKNCLTARLDHFPEALICNYKIAQSNTAMEVGCILLEKPPLVKKSIGLNWNVGVDFGTSSTMLYVVEGKQKAKALNFEPHLLKITESLGARAQTFINFVASNPPKRPDGSFLSIFHLLNVENFTQIRPLLEGNVLSFIRRDIFERYGDRIETNLKWKSETLERRKVAAYIGQVCLQVLVEAAAHGVDSVSWNFSYPTAFSHEQRLAFEVTCRDSVTDAYDNSGFIVDTDKDIESWSESKASAYYFNNVVGNFVNGALCIDIGAGTTDISIISDQPGRIVYHTSVQFAGRQIFKPIYDNYQLFVPKGKMDEIEYDVEEQQQALIDADMRANSDNYINDLKFKTGNNDVKAVLQKAQFAVAGLFFYLGKIINILHDINCYNDSKIPSVYVGGNGSRIFHWLAGGTGVNNNPYFKVLEQMLVDTSGLGRRRRFDLILSDYPKSEVVTGMIIPKPNNDDTFFDNDRIDHDIFGENQNEYVYSSMMAGAEFIQEDELQEAASFISAYDLSAGITIDSLNEFKQFLECFNNSPKRWASDDITLDDENAEDIIREVNGVFINSKDMDVKKIFVEPVFIVELKRFMERLS